MPAESEDARENRLLSERWIWEQQVIAAQAGHEARLKSLEAAVLGIGPAVLKLTELATRFEGTLEQFRQIDKIRETVEELSKAETHRQGADSRTMRNALATGAGGGLIAWAIAWVAAHFK